MQVFTNVGGRPEIKRLAETRDGKWPRSFLLVVQKNVFLIPRDNHLPAPPLSRGFIPADAEEVQPAAENYGQVVHHGVHQHPYIVMLCLLFCNLTIHPPWMCKEFRLFSTFCKRCDIESIKRCSPQIWHVSGFWTLINCEMWKCPIFWIGLNQYRK